MARTGCRWTGWKFSDFELNLLVLDCSKSLNLVLVCEMYQISFVFSINTCFWPSVKICMLYGRAVPEVWLDEAHKMHVTLVNLSRECSCKGYISGFYPLNALNWLSFCYSKNFFSIYSSPNVWPANSRMVWQCVKCVEFQLNLPVFSCVESLDLVFVCLLFEVCLFHLKPACFEQCVIRNSSFLLT